MNNPYLFAAQATRRQSAPGRALRLEAQVGCLFRAGWKSFLARELFINFTFKSISKISRVFLFIYFVCLFLRKSFLDSGAKYNFRLKHTRVSLAFSTEEPAAGSWNCHWSERRGRYRSPSCLLHTEVSAPTLPGCCSHTLIFLLHENLVCLSSTLLWNKRKCCNSLKSRSMAEQVSCQSSLVYRSFEMRWFVCRDLQDTKKPGKSDTVLGRALGRAYRTGRSCAHQPLPEARAKKELLMVSHILCLFPQSWATPLQNTQRKARLPQGVGLKPATKGGKTSALTMFEKMDFTLSQRQGKKRVSIRQKKRKKKCFDISCSSLTELEWQTGQQAHQPEPVICPVGWHKRYSFRTIQEYKATGKNTGGLRSKWLLRHSGRHKPQQLQRQQHNCHFPGFH